MTNSKALFYPTIEISNENWLKANLLFWDEIHTIVPESFSRPYTNRTTSILSERQILRPELVNPDHYAVRELSDNLLEFINTEEGYNLIWSGDNVHGIHRDKMARIHHDKLSERLFRLHPSKLSHELRYILEDNMDSEWFWVSSSFASYYMTMLANKICDENGYRLLTDNPLCSNLSDKVKLGIKGLNPEIREFRPNRINQQLAQGFLINLIIERINFYPTTNVIDILSFKENHKDALGLFRTNLKKLLKEIPDNDSVKILKEEVGSIYNDEFLPAYNNLKKQLDSSGIKWTADNFAKVGFFSVSTTSIPLHLLGLTVPQALLAGAGVSLIASLISYNIDKQNTLRDNPYNYLLEVEREL